MSTAEQTFTSFRDKWENNPDLAFAMTQREGSEIHSWILNRNGFADSEALRAYLADKKRVLDAGCGNGRVTALLHTNVAESDIGRLQAGMAASFTVDAYPNERFTGRIRTIRNAPQVVQNVVTYDAVIDVANPDLRLKPGMTATVTVIADRRAAVLRVPNAALRFRPAGDEAQAGSPGAGGAAAGGAAAGRRAVFVLEQGRLQRRELTVGLSDGRFTEVTGGGLREGEVVVTGAEGGAAGGAQRGMRMRIL